MIEVISPAGFEGFFRSLSQLQATGNVSAEEVQKLAAAYGLQLGRPDWLPDLISRYGLNPPPLAVPPA